MPKNISDLKIKDGFKGEKQINVPRDLVINNLRKQKFLNHLFITNIGYFPKAKFHFRERQYGSHDDILIYCVGGKGYFETTEDQYTLEANEFVILPRGEYHNYQADIRNPWSIYWIHFSGTHLKHLNSWVHINQWKKPTPIDYDKCIIEQWLEIYTVLENGFSEHNLAYANLKLYGFLANFLVPKSNYQILNLPNPIGDSIAYMKANIDQLITVDDLSKQLQLSNSYYAALFKSKTGASPIDYFIKLKIQYACQLLRQTDFKVNEISSKLGYEDSLYFSRLFKKITGKSPREYRQKE